MRQELFARGRGQRLLQAGLDSELHRYYICHLSWTHNRSFNQFMSRHLLCQQNMLRFGLQNISEYKRLCGRSLEAEEIVEGTMHLMMYTGIHT